MFWNQKVDLSALLPTLKSEQDSLRAQIVLKPLRKEVKLIAGCDSSLIGDDIFSIFVVFTYPDLREIEVKFHQSKLPLPYIPGFLAFREIPNLLLAYEKLEHKPDLIMVDGQGIMHPRRMGIATHLGIKLGVPTIGVGKSKLFGTYTKPATTKGSFTYVTHKDEVLGIALQSKNNVNPLFVSPGHLCDVETALKIVLSTLTTYRLPEPTRIADKYSKELKVGSNTTVLHSISMLTTGTQAPDFSLLDQDKKIHRLSDYIGKWLVIYFYPKDDTPDCTKEACSFRDNIHLLQEKGIEVLGVSKDTVRSHTKFASKHKLTFPLLSDPEKTMMRNYGVLGPKKFMGREYEGVFRTTFLVNPKGVIRKVYENVEVNEHVQEILSDLESLTQ